MTDIAELCREPSWFPVDLDAVNSSFVFARTTREALSAAPFLDQRCDFGSSVTEKVDAARLGAALLANDTGKAAPAVIFHTAFCCSTLLAAVLDTPGRVLALKEPAVLMSVANLHRTGAGKLSFESTAAATFSLLGRGFSPNERVLIKPTNSANNLAPAALASGARVLLLYSGLREFLVSIIKKGEACRYFVRHLFNILQLDRPDIDAWPQRQKLLLTDLQVAALVWSLQIDQFQNLVAGSTSGQVRSLNAADFLAQPRLALAACARFLALPLSDDEIDTASQSQRFNSHSKFADQLYDSAARQAEAQVIENQYAEALDVTVEWTRRLRGGEPPAKLPRDLLNDTP